MSSLSATGKVVLITGATGGLGSSLVREFALAGHHVAVLYRTAEGLARTLCADFSDRMLSVRADVADFSSVQAAVADVLAAWGRLDVLVNSAGITRDAVLIRQQEADWDEVMAVNLTGVFHVVRAAAAAMTGGGHIIMISSYSGLKGKEGQAAYSASKAALFGLAKTAAIELGPAGICVNAVLPGYLPVGMGPRAESAMKKARRDSLLGCLSDSGEAARFVVHLTKMRSVTGQIFCLDSRIV